MNLQPIFSNLSLVALATFGIPSLHSDPGSSIRPITNPTLFDSAVPQSNVHAIYMHHTFPSQIETAIGNVPFDGDLNLLAVQFEYALSETLSIVATKDGYIDFNPDATMTEADGFANLAAGIKYMFLQDEDKSLAMSSTVTVELPTGNRDVWQGEGDGYLNAILNTLKGYGKYETASSAGIRLPFASEDPTIAFYSAHVNYDLENGFYPLAEFNWFRVLSSGNGTSRFPDQVGGAVPAIGVFEGGDLITLGSQYASFNKNIMTAAIGFRYQFNDEQNLGVAYETVLTGKEDNLMNSRVTLDYIFKF